MAKEGNSTITASWRELFSVALYKRSQGRIVRQVTFGVLILMLALGAWSLNNFLSDKMPQRVDSVVTLVVLVVGAWLCYRVVNWSRFADFLIAVEAEMNKVSWPSRGELFRSSLVVMVTMFGLAGILFAYDILWRYVLTAIGVIQTSL